MLGLFKKKSTKEKLQAEYAKLLKEAHALSTSNRKLSDQKIFEAEEIMIKIEMIG
ncbi:MAG: Lacal_2735 family protein [Eudoraea sp.]|nr:Lacal_2735 family protein [Eudoraea sp.]